jgi:hypothetical protein
VDEAFAPSHDGSGRVSVPLPVSVATQAASRVAQSSSQLPPVSGVSAEKQVRRAALPADAGEL